MSQLSIKVRGEAVEAAREKADLLQTDLTAYVKLAVEVANQLPRPILRLIEEVERSQNEELRAACDDLLRRFAFEANGLLFSSLNDELSHGHAPVDAEVATRRKA